jgi:peptidoglycan/LPS O-acetylase OafA/YrhL
MKIKTIINYRPDIDGLRALAVIMVIAYHAFPKIFYSGFIGVDVFFVISGFLISGIILKMLKNNEFTFYSFYSRRVKRIFPALIIVLLTCLLFGWFFLFSEEYLSLVKNVLAGAGFFSNILYYFESGYFDISTNLKPLIHLWSLGVEEQFYIFWPIILVFIFKKRKKILTPMIIILLLSLLLNIFIGFKNPSAAFYLTLTRFWEFVSGAIIAYLNFSEEETVSVFLNKLKFKLFAQNKRKIITKNLLSIVGAALILLSLFIINEGNFYSGLVIISIIGVCLIIVAGPSAFINKKILSNKLLVYIGLISYPLYLWHWPLFSFANIIKSGEPTTDLKLLLIVVSFVLAWLTYEFVEKKIRYSINKKWVFILLLLMLLVFTLSLIIYFNKGFNKRFPNQEVLLKQITLSPTVRLSAARDKINGRELCLRLYPQKIKNIICLASDDGPNKVFIIGDSHTRFVYDGYHQILVNKGYSVINLGISSCPYLEPEETNQSESHKNCNNYFKKIIDIIKKEKPKAILISNDGWYSEKNLFKQGMSETLSSLPKDIPLIWFLQTPRPPFSLAKCVSRSANIKNFSQDCSFEKNIYTEYFYGYAEAVEEIKKNYPRLITVNPSNVLCDKERCSIILNNNFLYIDNKSHLSLYGSYFVANKLPIDQYLPSLK